MEASHVNPVSIHHQAIFLEQSGVKAGCTDFRLSVEWLQTCTVRADRAGFGWSKRGQNMADSLCRCLLKIV